MKQTKKTFLIASLSIFTVLGSVFVFEHKSFAQESQIAVEVAVAGNPTETGEQILSLLQELNAIQLDDSIFSDPMFLSLKDFHIDLAEEPKQRSNPFAPIGQDEAVLEPTPVPVSNPIQGKSSAISIPLPDGVTTNPYW